MNFELFSSRSLGWAIIGTLEDNFSQENAAVSNLRSGDVTKSWLKGHDFALNTSSRLYPVANSSLARRKPATRRNNPIRC